MIVNKYANGNGGGGGTGSTITVDAALSTASTNPVENRVITTALSEYTTNEYVESRFDAAEAYTDSQVNNLEEQLNAAITAATENMATQDYVDTAINEELQDYATEAYVDNAITAATEDLASTQYVDDAIAGIVIPEPPEDYATTGDVANAVEGLASESYVDDAISAATQGMATQSDLEGLASQEYVDNAVNDLTLGIGMLGMVNDVSESNGTVTVRKTGMQDGHLVTGSTSFDIVTSGDIQNFVTSGDVATAITAATENLATEQYVDDAIAAIPTGSTVTVDSALSSSSTNPVQNKVIANKFADYVTKLELTGDTETVELELTERNADYTYKFAYGIMMPTEASGSMKDTNVDSIKAIRIGDETSSMPMDDGVSLYYFNLNGTNYIPANNTIGSKVSLVQGGSSASASVQYPSITASEMDGYYFIVDLSDMTVLVTNTLPTITTGTPGILDDYVTSGDVQDIVDEAMTAYTITVDDEISTASTNPVENRAIYDALNGVSSSTQMEIIESATTSVCVSASTIGNIYFKETNLPDYLAINLGEYITGYTIFYGINDGTTSKFDTDTYDGSIIEPEKLGVRCPLYGESNITISSSNLDGTYNYYMVYNQVKKYVVIYKNLPVIAEVSDHAANISDVPVAQNGSDTKYYVYSGTGNKKVLTDVWLTTTVQHDSTYRRLNIEYNSTVWGNLEKNTSTFIIPGGNANQPGVKTYRDSVVIDNAMGALNGLTETKTLTIGNQTSNYLDGDSRNPKYYLCETDDPRYLVYHSVGNEYISSEYVYLNGITYYYLNVFGGSSEDRIITPDEVYPSAFTGCIMQLGEYKPEESYKNTLDVQCPANSDTYFIVDKELHTIQVTDSLTFTRAKNIKETIDNNCVQSTDVRTMVKCTQAQYDAMQSHDPNTFYIITNS